MILTDPAHISERKNPATREDPTETCCWRLSKACLCSWESFLAGQASGDKTPHKCFPHVCASRNHKVWVTHRDIESCHLPKHPNQTSWFCSKKCPPNMKKANWSLRRTQERKKQFHCCEMSLLTSISGNPDVEQNGLCVSSQRNEQQEKGNWGKRDKRRDSIMKIIL